MYEQILKNLMFIGYEVLMLERNLSEGYYRLRLKGAHILDVTVYESEVVYKLSGKVNETRKVPITQYEQAFPRKEMDKVGLFGRYKVESEAKDRYFEIIHLISAIPANTSYKLTSKGDEFSIEIPSKNLQIKYRLDYLYINGYQELQPTRKLTVNGKSESGVDLRIYTKYLSLVSS